MSLRLASKGGTQAEENYTFHSYSDVSFVGPRQKHDVILESVVPAGRQPRGTHGGNIGSRSADAERKDAEWQLFSDYSSHVNTRWIVALLATRNRVPLPMALIRYCRPTDKAINRRDERKQQGHFHNSRFVIWQAMFSCFWGKQEMTHIEKDSQKIRLRKPSTKHIPRSSNIYYEPRG